MDSKLKDIQTIDIAPVSTTGAIVPVRSAAPITRTTADPELLHIANEVLALSPNKTEGKAQYLANLVKQGDRTTLTTLHHQMQEYHINLTTNSHNTSNLAFHEGDRSTHTNHQHTTYAPVYVDARRVYQVHQGGGGNGVRDLNVHLFNGRRDESDRPVSHNRTENHFHGSFLMILAFCFFGWLAFGYMNGLSSSLDRDLAGDKAIPAEYNQF